MAENSEVNENSETQTETHTEIQTKEQKKKSKYVFVAIVALLALIFLSICGYIAHVIKAPKEESQAVKTQKPEVGVVRIRDAVKAHKDYEEIAKLHDEYESLLADMMAYSEPVQIKLPEPDKQAFADSAQQKLSQTIVDRIAALEEKRSNAVKKYAKDTESAYEAKRAEIDARYLNVIADLRMKLDNADILRLTDEKITELSHQLDALQRERSEAQDALKAQREQEIYNYGEKVIESYKGEIASIDAEANRLMSEAALKESETQERNMRLLEESVGSERIIAMREKEARLQTIKDELREVEERIFSDIASSAAKYAAQRDLSLVVANVGINIKSLLPIETDLGEEGRYSKVFTINSVDITDDIINDLLVK